jgi:hypothetical protein
VTITEGQRHELHEGLVQAIGRERAETLMSMLPPLGWADVATKDDIAATKEYVDLRLEVTENRILAKLHEELRHQLWAIVGGLWVSVLVSLVAAVVLDHVLS